MMGQLHASRSTLGLGTSCLQAGQHNPVHVEWNDADRAKRSAYEVVRSHKTQPCITSVHELFGKEAACKKINAGRSLFRQVK